MENRYPPIADYAFISDLHSMALISSAGSIDWCCMPRVDSSSVFGRLLDWDRGGHCAIGPIDPDADSFQEYVDDTLVLRTTFRTDGGEAEIFDCFAMHSGGSQNPHLQLLRIIQGVRGRVDLRIRVEPRFDYGEVRPWIRRHSERAYSAIGGSDGLLITCDEPLDICEEHSLEQVVRVRAESRVRLALEFRRPSDFEYAIPDTLDPRLLDQRLEETLRWWRRWTGKITLDGPHRSGVIRSAIVLKGLTHAPTGAMAAAPTTSLPETPGGIRNWDYRFSWIRDSSFAVRSLADIGCPDEADGFRRFVQRSSAGSARDLQVMYGLGGERRLTEIELALEGYRGAHPVRIGNAASGQLQLDAYGTLMDLTWRWHRRGQSPDDDYWRFLVDMVETAAARWEEADHGIWEIRGKPQHFVHSKAMCWVAVNRGIQLADECMRKAPTVRWKKIRRQMREAIDTRGVDRRRGCYVQSFDNKVLDGSLLLLPGFGYCAYDDPLMVGTVDAILEDLVNDSLVLRYQVEDTDDGLEGREGTFLACTFWLAEVLAKQGRLEEAHRAFDRAASTASGLGLMAEEYMPSSGEMLGNFPQALTHLSHITAAVALTQAEGGRETKPY